MNLQFFKYIFENSAGIFLHFLLQRSVPPYQRKSLLCDGAAPSCPPAVAAEDVGMPGWLEGFFRVLTNWR